MDVYLYNTLTRKKEKLQPVSPPEVRVYHCGPTVYYDVHIGNLFSFLFRDVLVRTLDYAGYKTKVVMNITDVGHLVGDEDEGEDKLEKQAKKEGKSAESVAEQYIKRIFGNLDFSENGRPGYDLLGDMGKMNFLRPDVLCKATEHIDEMREMIESLAQKGYTYITQLGIYFDVTKYKKYGQLSGQKLEDKLKSVREDVVEDSDKKHPADFALWLFTKGMHKNHQMKWDSPKVDELDKIEGAEQGFPGWHIECSAMSSKHLGNPFDIHTGGVDNIPVHHENEIAQTECALGKKMVKIWMHNEHILVDGGKMSKSEGNFYTLEDVIGKGYTPLDLRYFFLNSHYRSQANFTWEALDAARSAYNNLAGYVKTWVYEISKKAGLSAGEVVELAKGKKVEGDYPKGFQEQVCDDLNIPAALGIAWKATKDQILDLDERLAMILDFDKVLGLKLDQVASDTSLDEGKKIDELTNEREKMRGQGKWEEADKLRDEVEGLGVELEDTSQGPAWRWKSLK